ncbi:glycosyltransferase [Pelagicoccus sp. SDUM812005]|uniref:glycosyltransferase n=1 Tax=Pelagicoccus sp. SDUM812005 TaxID=3041257 RepID=UPI00280DDD0D|nr:glycosyltransferase [Pelagicoccus sp. SDUM812005]
MKISVVISTYNSSDWLEKVLWGYENQRDRDFEIVLADDGSNAVHCSRIEKLMGSSPLEIQHVWQDDLGFRKTMILNIAIRKCRGEYVIITDGDCIPRSDFVMTHRNLAEFGRYLSGGYIKLPMKTSRAILKEDVVSGCAFRYRWLRESGLAWNRKNSKLLVKGRFARMLDKLTPTKPSFNGQNSSAWKKDILKVNGFDNRMAYGAEDCELGMRLSNAGVTGKCIRYSAIAVHLDHARGYVTEDGWELSRRIRTETRKRRLVATRFGIAQLDRAEAARFSVVRL